MIRRGEIYWTDFDGGRGAEIRKTRPAVVVSGDEHNAHMATVTVAPLSSSAGPVRPHEVPVPRGTLGDGRAAKIKVHQLRAVDKSRVGRRLGRADEALMSALGDELRRHLAL